MNLFARLALVYFIILSALLITVLNSFYDDIKPSFRQISEESLVDTANLLAELVVLDKSTSSELFDQNFLQNFDRQVQDYRNRTIDAQIWSHRKNQHNINFYITDAQGQVRYHSDDPSQIGEDYSRWLDVSRTLRGEYGARTSRKDKHDELTSAMYVAAPIAINGVTIGVLSVIQPHQSILPFIGKTQRQMLWIGLLVLLTLMLSGVLLVYWYRRMHKRLANYVESIRLGEKASEPKFHDHDFSHLASTLNQLRSELDGKLYIENYIHTLTHELKSPLAAIAAASELLQGPLEKPQQEKFIGNIDAEVKRLQQIIDQLLLLASLENKQTTKTSSIEVKACLQQEIEAIALRLAKKSIRLDTNQLESTPANTTRVQGDHFLIKTALSNLLTNALDFCPEQGRLRVSLNSTSTENLEVTIENTGPHIPEYAKDRLFERFFSTPRPDTMRKSSGLGLCLVEQICQLHHGQIALDNSQWGNDAAVRASITLPSKQ